MTTPARLHARTATGLVLDLGEHRVEDGVDIVEPPTIPLYDQVVGRRSLGSLWTCRTFAVAEDAPHVPASAAVRRVLVEHPHAGVVGLGEVGLQDLQPDRPSEGLDHRRGDHHAGLRAGGAGELLAVVDDNLEVGGNQVQHFAGLMSDADLVRPANRADAQRGLDRHLDAPPRQVRRRPLAFRRALGFGSLLGCTAADSYGKVSRRYATTSATSTGSVY